MVELFIDTKKELTIEESSCLKIINFLNFQNGGASRKDYWFLRKILDEIDFKELKNFF